MKRRSQAKGKKDSKKQKTEELVKTEDLITYISLLRGININGSKVLKMKDLKELYISLGFQQVETYIQTGNVVFKYKETELCEIEKTITDKIKEEYGYDVPTTIRFGHQLNSLINHSFWDNSENEKQRYFVFLKENRQEINDDEEIIDQIDKVKSKNETYLIEETEVLINYGDGLSRVRMDNNFFEKKLNTACTTRNWRTVNKLYEMVSK